MVAKPTDGLDFGDQPMRSRTAFEFNGKRPPFVHLPTSETAGSRYDLHEITRARMSRPRPARVPRK